MRDIGAALRALGPRRGVDKLTGVGDAHGVLDLEVVIIRAPLRDANRRGVHDSGGIAFNDDLGARPSSGACTGLPGGHRDRAHNVAVLEDVHLVFVDVNLDDSRLTNLEGTLDVMGDPAVTGGRETGEVAAHVDFRAGLPKILGAPHQLGMVDPSPRSLLLWGDINVHGLLNPGAHVSVDDLVPELDDDRHADANRSVAVEHLDDVDGAIDALDVFGHRRCRASMGVGIREGRSDGVRGLETPRFRRGPHCVLESARDFAALGIRDLDVLEGSIGDSKLQRITRLELGDRVVCGDCQSGGGWGRSRRRGGRVPTRAKTITNGGLGAGSGCHWQSDGTCSQNRTTGQSRWHSTSMIVCAK